MQSRPSKKTSRSNVAGRGASASTSGSSGSDFVERLHVWIRHLHENDVTPTTLYNFFPRKVEGEDGISFTEFGTYLRTRTEWSGASESEIFRCFSILVLTSNREAQVTQKIFAQFKQGVSVVRKLVTLIRDLLNQGETIDSIFKAIPRDSLSNKVTLNGFNEWLSQREEFRGDSSVGRIYCFRIVDIDGWGELFKSQFKVFANLARPPLKDLTTMSQRIAQWMREMIGQGRTNDDLFDELDTDNSEGIDVHELEVWLRSIDHFKDISAIEVRGLMELIDLDRDQLIDRKEFVSFMQGRKENEASSIISRAMKSRKSEKTIPHHLRPTTSSMTYEKEGNEKKEEIAKAEKRGGFYTHGDGYHDLFMDWADKEKEIARQGSRSGIRPMPSTETPSTPSETKKVIIDWGLYKSLQTPGMYQSGHIPATELGIVLGEPISPTSLDTIRSGNAYGTDRAILNGLEGDVKVHVYTKDQRLGELNDSFIFTLPGEYALRTKFHPQGASCEAGDGRSRRQSHAGAERASCIPARPPRPHHRQCSGAARAYGAVPGRNVARCVDARRRSPRRRFEAGLAAAK